MNNKNLFFVAILSEDSDKLKNLEKLFNRDLKIDSANWKDFLPNCNTSLFTEDPQFLVWCEMIDEDRLELSGWLENGVETDFWQQLSETLECEVNFEYHSEKDNLALNINWCSGEEDYYDEISCVRHYFFNEKETFWETVSQWGWTVEDFENEIGEYLEDWQLEELKKILEA